MDSFFSLFSFVGCKTSIIPNPAWGRLCFVDHCTASSKGTLPRLLSHRRKKMALRPCFACDSRQADAVRAKACCVRSSLSRSLPASPPVIRKPGQIRRCHGKRFRGLPNTDKPSLAHTIPHSFHGCAAICAGVGRARVAPPSPNIHASMSALSVQSFEPLCCCSGSRLAVLSTT